MFFILYLIILLSVCIYIYVSVVYEELGIFKSTKWVIVHGCLLHGAASPAPEDRAEPLSCI